MTYGSLMPVLRCRDRTIDIRRPLVMGVINATPDSFSDGGDLRTVDEAVAARWRSCTTAPR